MDTEIVKEDLRKWFKDGGWNRYNTKGEKVGKCARDDKDGDGKADGPKPKCLPASKAASLGKKKVAAAVKRKRAEDPNPNRTGAAKNVKTESTELELRVSEFMEACWKGYEKKGMKTMFGKRYPNCVKKTRKEEVELDEIAPLAIGAAAAGLAAAPYLAKKFLKPKADKALDNARQNATLNGKPFGAGARQRAIERGAGVKPGTLDPKMQRLRNSYEPEGEVVSERSRLDGPEERKKDLDKRYDPKGGGKNPFQYVPVKQATAKNEEVEKIQENNPRVTGIPNNPSILQRVDAMLPGRAMTYQGFKDKTRKPYQYTSPETGPNYKGNKTDVDNYRAGGGNAAVKDGKSADQVRAQGAKNLKARPKIPNVHNWKDGNVKTYAGNPPMRFNVGEGKSDGDPCWDSHKQVGMKKKGGKMVPNCVPKEEVEVSHKNPESVKGIAKELDKAVEMHKSQAKRLRKAGVSEGAAWTKKSGKNSEGGLNEKGRKSYERENPGSDLKRPSKKVGNKRRASFCARMKGMRKRQKPSNNTGEDRLSKSLRAWNC